MMKATLRAMALPVIYGAVIARPPKRPWQSRATCASKCDSGWPRWLTPARDCLFDLLYILKIPEDGVPDLRWPPQTRRVRASRLAMGF